MSSATSSEKRYALSIGRSTDKDVESFTRPVEGLFQNAASLSTDLVASTCEQARLSFEREAINSAKRRRIDVITDFIRWALTGGGIYLVITQALKYLDLIE